MSGSPRRALSLVLVLLTIMAGLWSWRHHTCSFPIAVTTASHPEAWLNIPRRANATLIFLYSPGFHWPACSAQVESLDAQLASFPEVESLVVADGRHTSLRAVRLYQGATSLRSRVVLDQSGCLRRAFNLREGPAVLGFSTGGELVFLLPLDALKRDGGVFQELWSWLCLSLQGRGPT